METRILIPKELKVVVEKDEGKAFQRKKVSRCDRDDGDVDEDNEKPSSSSGHFETEEETAIMTRKKSNRNQFIFSSASSSSSSASDISSEDDQIELENSRNLKSTDEIIGSSEMTFKERKTRKKKTNERKTVKSCRDGVKIKICANTFIEKGTMFSPEEGDVQIVHLNEMQPMSKDDVRFIFGCFESVTSKTTAPLLTPTSPTPVRSESPQDRISLKQHGQGLIRLCNWVRFLPPQTHNKMTQRISSSNAPSKSDLASDDDSEDADIKNEGNRLNEDVDGDSSSEGQYLKIKKFSGQRGNYQKQQTTNAHYSQEIYEQGIGRLHNITAKFVDGRPRFEATRPILPGTELVPYYDMYSFFPQAEIVSPFFNSGMMIAGASPSIFAQSSSKRNMSSLSAMTPSPSTTATYPLATNVTSSSSNLMKGVTNCENNEKEVNHEDAKGHGASKKQQQFSLSASSLPHFPFHPYTLHHHYQYYQQQLQLFQQQQYLTAAALQRQDKHEERGRSGESPRVAEQTTRKESDDGFKLESYRNDDKPSFLCKVKTETGEEDPAEKSYAIRGLKDGPLDLSPEKKAVPATHQHSYIKQANPVPLKVSTPFDSPDSNEDDKTEAEYKETSDLYDQSKNYKMRSNFQCINQTPPENMFSIRNVLKHKFPPSPPPSSVKLFQPYSFDNHEEKDTTTTIKQEHSADESEPVSPINRSCSSNIQPSSTLMMGNLHRSTLSQPLLMRKTVLRPMGPILRTRGRERSMLPCEVCGKAFDRPSLLKRHLRTHTGEKPHVCDVCSKGFSTSSSLNTHRRIHSGEKPHQCQICGKRFTASSNLYYHRMTHNKEKPHKCLLCGKSFPTPGDLKSHQYVHSGSWPYNCSICHRGFSKQTNLRNHLLLHNGMASNANPIHKQGEKPHICHICNKKFTQASNLRHHLKTHQDSQYKSTNTCTVCNRVFLDSSNISASSGRCRECQFGSSSVDSHNSPDASRPGSNVSPLLLKSPLENSMLRQNKMISPGAIPPLNHHHLSLSSPQNRLPSLVLPQIHSPLSNGLYLPSNLGQGFHYPPTAAPPQLLSQPTANSVAAAAAAAAASLLRNANESSANSNPFLEHLVGWNYRFAKEATGNLNLGFMQQRLLESQVLAAQFMNAQGFGMRNNETTLEDIIRLRNIAATGSEGFRSLDSITREANNLLQPQ